MKTTHSTKNQFLDFVRILTAALFVLLCFYTTERANATILQASGNASPSSISSSSNGQSQISWQINQSSTTGGTATVSSANGIFLTIDGSLIGTQDSPIQSSRLTQIRATTLFVINENLTIPLSIIRSSQRAGSSRIIYQRTFVDSQDGSTRAASVNLQINNGSIASELIINRIQIEFDDRRKIGTYGKNAKFNATALLSYEGTGLFEYTWEIATPPSTKGQPIYQPLSSRKQYLLSGGQATIQSPGLPSLLQGNYLVRLKISNIDSRIALPSIRYSISSSMHRGLDNRQSTITPSYPNPDALLMPSTEFKWSSVAEATAYQLEIHTKPYRNIGPVNIEQEKPITGVLIPAERTALKIGEVSRSYLVPGNTYYWRVIAINETGQVIALSDFRKIRF